jgi:hypothetical protein
MSSVQDASKAPCRETVPGTDPAHVYNNPVGRHTTLTYLFLNDARKIPAAFAPYIPKAGAPQHGKTAEGHSYTVVAGGLFMKTNEQPCDVRGRYGGVCEYTTDPAEFARGVAWHGNQPHMNTLDAFAWGTPLDQMVERARDRVMRQNNDTLSLRTWEECTVDVIYFTVQREPPVKCIKLFE